MTGEMRGRCGYRDTEERTEAETGVRVSQTKDSRIHQKLEEAKDCLLKVSEWVWPPCSHLDFGLQTVGDYIPVVLSHWIYGNGSPGKPT